MKVQSDSQIYLNQCVFLVENLDKERMDFVDCYEKEYPADRMRQRLETIQNIANQIVPFALFCDNKIEYNALINDLNVRRTKLTSESKKSDLQSPKNKKKQDSTCSLTAHSIPKGFEIELFGNKYHMMSVMLSFMTSDDEAFRDPFTRRTLFTVEKVRSLYSRCNTYKKPTILKYSIVLTNEGKQCEKKILEMLKRFGFDSLNDFFMKVFKEAEEAYDTFDMDSLLECDPMEDTDSKQMNSSLPHSRSNEQLRNILQISNNEPNTKRDLRKERFFTHLKTHPDTAKNKTMQATINTFTSNGKKKS